MVLVIEFETDCKCACSLGGHHSVLKSLSEGERSCTVTVLLIIVLISGVGSGVIAFRFAMKHIDEPKDHVHTHTLLECLDHSTELAL